ncbi:MAG: 50S ribosomal protein L18 [Planctomycetaceae bacterium]
MKVLATRQRRAWRVRKATRSQEGRPRLTVFRSGKHIYAQVIDDGRGHTICASSSRAVCGGYGGTVAHAKQVGADLAKRALALEIKKVCFDRGPYRYHGRVRALAEGARGEGLEF